MSFFGRPVSSVFNGNVAMGAVEGAIAGLVGGYVEARASRSEHPFRKALSTGVAWASMDVATEVGINILSPNLRAGGGVQSAVVSAAIGGATGFAEGFAEGKVRGEDNPWKRAAYTGSAWAALDGAWELGATPIRRLVNNKFPR